jgi:hypothetical protein
VPRAKSRTRFPSRILPETIKSSAMLPAI